MHYLLKYQELWSRTTNHTCTATYNFWVFVTFFGIKIRLEQKEMNT